MAKDVSITEFKGDAKNLVSAIDQIKTHSDDLDKSLQVVLTHLQDIEKGLKNVKSITNNANSISNNINAKNNSNIFDFGTQKHIVKGSAGFMGSDSNKSKAFKDYEQAVIQETQEITKDIAERKRLRQQRANAETTAANAASLRATKMEDQTSVRYLDRMDKLAEARMLNAKNNQKNKNLNDPRYQTGKAFSAIGGIVSSYGTGGKLIGGLLDSIGTLVKAPVAGAATAVTNLVKGISDLGSEAVKAYSEIESIKTQLGIVYSSQTQANTAFGQISEYAVHSPFGIQQTSELAVLLKQSGVYATDLMDTLRMLGDTAGGNMEKMKRIANNYAQIVSIGKASMLDMRQFAYAGIPIFEAVSNELKVSQTELRKMISDGKVTSDIIEKVFKDLTGINGIFENATEVGAKTLKARLQNLKDAQQLAFASMGESLVNWGTQTGNDSYANKIVSGLEKMYEYIKESVNTKNLEASVKVIERRNDRIKQLQDLIEINKDNKETLRHLENALARELSKRDVEQERATYSASYDDKVESFKEIFEAVGTIDLKTAQNKLYNMQDWYSTDAFSKNYLKEDARYKDFSMLDDESLLIAIDELKDYIHLIRTLTKVTEEEIKAHRESNLINAQQLAYDQMSKRADATTSLNSSFQELLSIYRDSDEYKEKEEEKKQKTLEEAKQILKKIAENTDDSGVYNITNKTNLDDLYNWIKSGAFTPGRKLSVVEGKSTSQKEEDRAILMQQINYLASQLRTVMAPYDVDRYLTSFSKTTLNKLDALSPEEFYKQFSVYYKNMEDDLANLSSNTKNLSPEIRKAILSKSEMFTELLPIMLSTLEAETGGKNADTTQSGKAGQEFIPLWKRILASATGLSAEGITNTKQTLSNYRDDMAVRSLASGVMTAAVKNMDTATAMRLAKASNTVAQLTGAPAQTVQIDWKATRDAIKDFALQVSASTEVITAYKNALQDEYNTFASLVAAGYTTPESQDLKNQKYVSGEKYSRLIASAGSQLVNAFGEKLKTAEGKDVWLQSNGKFYDVESLKDLKDEEIAQHEVQVDELVVTESLFEIIKQTLPKIEKEMHEANMTLIKNQAVEKALNNVKTTQLTSKMLDYSTPLQQQITSFFVNNPDALTSAFDSGLKVVKNKYQSYYDFVEGVSDADVLSISLSSGRGEYVEVMRQIVDETLQMIRDEIAGDVVYGPNDRSIYGQLTDLGLSNDKITAMTEALEKMAKVSDFYSKNLSPEEYEGWRGTRNFALKALGVRTENFDKEDFYAAAMRAGYRSDNVDLSQWKGAALKDSDLVEYLSAADKKALDLEYHFEQIKDIVKDFATNMLTTFNEFAQGAFLAPFEQLGESLVTGEDYAEGLGDKMKQLGADLISQMGTYMARAGFALVTMGAETLNPALVAGGLALAAAGGFASGLGGALKEGEQNKDKSDKETQKLENLKNDLQKLLEQARTDALYYENNLRHKTALGTNKEFSYKSVHDAVITPQGDVVTTDPKDYLIATKTPQNFVGGGNVTVSPVINCNVVNNTPAQVRTEQTQNDDGSIDIVTIIEEVAGGYIASSRSDDAFNARTYRMNGKQAIM